MQGTGIMYCTVNNLILTALGFSKTGKNLPT